MSMADAAFLASRPELEDKEVEAYDYFLACLNGTTVPHKLRFLASIRMLCRAWSKHRNWPAFRTPDDMEAKIQALWKEEPLLSTGAVVRQLAILAIAAMRRSAYGYLSPCISSTFSLLSQKMHREKDKLTAQIQQTLDSVLQLTLCMDLTENMLLTVRIIFKALLPFLTALQVDQRQRAVSTLVSLSRVLDPPDILQAIREGKYFFFSSEKPLDTLVDMVAHFTLCCTEKDQEISSMAVEGLHIWLRFTLLRESSFVICMNPVLPVQLEMLCTFSTTEVNNDESVIFGHFFLPAERTKFLLTILSNIAHPRVSDLRPVANMVDAVLRDPSSTLSEVRQVVGAIYAKLLAIRHNPCLKDLLRKTLLRLAYLHPADVTAALLEVSAHCDSSARTVWKTLASKPLIAEYTFKEMLQIQNQEIKVTRSAEMCHCFPFLAISGAMQEIFQVPSNNRCVHYFFGELFMAVVLQISFFLKCEQKPCCHLLTVPREENLSLVDCVRSTVSTMQTLFRAVGGTSLVEHLWRQGAWPMLMSPDTFHTGISTLTRALRFQGMELSHCVFEQALVLLCQEENYEDMGVMAVFVELLDCIGSKPTDSHILRVLKAQLQNKSLVLRRMTLSSLVRLSRRPKQQAAVLGVLLPQVMEQLGDNDFEIKIAVLSILSNMLCRVDRETALSIALQLPERLLPLFENESRRMRELSIRLYRDAMGIAVNTNRAWQKKATLWKSLMPLFFLLHDQEQSVAQVSREVLLGVAKILKKKKLRKLLKTELTEACPPQQRVAACLLKDSSRLEEYLEQSLPYLQSSQERLRAEAVRFLGLLSQQLRPKQQEKLQTIYNALEDMQNDSSSTVSSLARETLMIQFGSRRRARSQISAGAGCATGS